MSDRTHSAVNLSPTKLPISCTLDPTLVAYHEVDLAAYADLDPEHTSHLANQLAVVAEFNGGLDPNVHKTFIHVPSEHLVTFEEKGKDPASDARYFKVTVTPLKNPDRWGKWWFHLRQREHRQGDIISMCQAFTKDPISEVLLTQLLIQMGRIVEVWALAHQRQCEQTYLKDPFSPGKPEHEWLQHKHLEDSPIRRK